VDDPIRLVAHSGNFGDRTFPEPANPGYTDCRVSHAGRLVLAAEAHRLAPVPAGLINGSTGQGGTRPPLKPFRVLGALRRLIENPRLPDSEILDVVGPPDFVSGCLVTGDLATLDQPPQGPLQIVARGISAPPDHRVDAPNVVATEALQAITSRSYSRPWAGSFPELHYHSTSAARRGRAAWPGCAGQESSEGALASGTSVAERCRGEAGRHVTH
jgi:hypothetical protein